jgi:hypothetical protein
MSTEADHRLLVILLRFGGTLTGSAFLTTLLPVEWMAATHEALGLGEYPRVPLVDYLARSVAALYGFHGVLLFILANNPVRYAGIVRYIGWMNVTFGTMLVLIDLHAGMPLWWTMSEGPPVVVVGLIVLYLSRSGIRDQASGARNEGSDVRHQASRGAKDQ